MAEPVTGRVSPCSFRGDESVIEGRLALTYVAAAESDLPMFEGMVRDAMAALYDTHQMAWQTDAFRAGFAATENYRIEQGGIIVGVLRFSVQAECLYLFDLHVASQMRQQGIGSQTLGALTVLAAHSGKSRIRLRSFRDNPANRLYLRAGFVPAGEEGTLLRFEKIIAQT